MTERRYGSFQRSVRLPDTLDEDKVEATLNNGVLKVSLPKRSEAIFRGSHCVGLMEWCLQLYGGR
jgi:HSP20 family molecular chaperone IbpA